MVCISDHEGPPGRPKAPHPPSGGGSNAAWGRAFGGAGHLPHHVPRVLLTLACLLLALPVAGVLGAWLRFDAAALAVLQHQARTVLPDYALQSLWLSLGVAAGVAVLGVASAVAVALFRFPGRAIFEWALLLPLAMPAYVLAYAYTDALQTSGPLQSALRAAFGWRGALWPDVRSLPGAVLLFVLCLYPYVYLLTRVALGERAAALMEAARLLGAGLGRRIVTVALPLARPAVMAGVALALMETLADYGVGAYFGLTTFTTGIYRAWLSMNDATAAAQLASALLAVIALLLALERRAQVRLRFAAPRGGSTAPAEAQRLAGLAGWTLTLLCALPVLLGFVLPTLWLAGMAAREAEAVPWARFGSWAWASFRVAALAALCATGLALALGFALRGRDRWSRRVLAPVVAADRARLCGARCGGGHRHLAAAGLAAGALARFRSRRVGHRHRGRRGLRLPGAVFGGRAADGRGRLRARADGGG